MPDFTIISIQIGWKTNCRHMQKNPEQISQRHTMTLSIQSFHCPSMPAAANRARAVCRNSLQSARRITAHVEDLAARFAATFATRKGRPLHEWTNGRHQGRGIVRQVLAEPSSHVPIPANVIR